MSSEGRRGEEKEGRKKREGKAGEGRETRRGEEDRGTYCCLNCSGGA